MRDVSQGPARWSSAHGTAQSKFVKDAVEHSDQPVPQGIVDKMAAAHAQGGKATKRSVGLDGQTAATGSVLLGLPGRGDGRQEHVRDRGFFLLRGLHNDCYRRQHCVSRVGCYRIYRSRTHACSSTASCAAASMSARHCAPTYGRRTGRNLMTGSVWTSGQGCVIRHAIYPCSRFSGSGQRRTRWSIQLSRGECRDREPARTGHRQSRLRGNSVPCIRRL